MDTFKVGDKVQLISGGPVMTVESVWTRWFGGAIVISCMWHDSTLSLPFQTQREDFSPGVLKKVD